MIPYGYRIHDARAVVDADEKQRIEILYASFVAGESLKDCAAASGIPRSVPTCKRILANEIYLGTDFYPALIGESLFAKARDELRRRDEAHKPREHGRYLTCAPVCTEFELAPESAAPRSRSRKKRGGPQELAARQFGRILAVHGAKERPSKEESPASAS